MPITLTLLDARTQLINIAGIDGKTGANSRHSVANLNLLLNRQYRMLLAVVAEASKTQRQVLTGPIALPGRLAGEDFQSIPFPVGTNEVTQLEVQLSGTWQKLDPLSFAQRRDYILSVPAVNSFAFVRYPPSGVGYYAVINTPQSAGPGGGGALSAGAIAIWPFGLTGFYKLVTVNTWPDLTADTDVFPIYDGWDEYFLHKAALTIIPRDGNKKEVYAQVRQNWLDANQTVRRAASRISGEGYSVPSNYGGISL